MHARALGLAALGAAFVVFVAGPVAAACSTGAVVGRWRHMESDQRWSFFSDKKIDCRVCQGWNDSGCIYVRDRGDPLGRQACIFKGPEASQASLRITNWVAKDGVLDHLVFSDGTTFNAAGEACRIDGSEGQMIIKGLGTFECQYNYQCEKLKR